LSWLAAEALRRIPSIRGEAFVTTILKTNRLRLREFEEGDVELLFALDSDPDVMRYISDGKTSTREHIEQAIPRLCAYYEKHPGFGIWVAELKESREFIGWACLKHLDQSELIEVGYRLKKDFWNQGYATEAAEALIQYGFGERGLDKIVAITNPDNKASQRVLEKCGLTRNGSGIYYGCHCLLFEISSD
jgi:ribosomal-protein-alanine N-acetyltransferase